jgi:hypothetical protein
MLASARPRSVSRVVTHADPVTHPVGDKNGTRLGPYLQKQNPGPFWGDSDLDLVSSGSDPGPGRYGAGQT